MKKLLVLGSMAMLMCSTAAYAVDAPATDTKLTPEQRREQIKNMSPEEKEKFFAERKAKWDAMSKEEKLVEIERKRKERIQYMEERWSKMTDDEKIAFVEKKMSRKHKGKHGGDDKDETDGKTE